MIEYDGINYNLDAIIQFQILKQFLEAIAKRQVDFNMLLYGKMMHNYNDSDENIKNIKINNKNSHLFNNLEKKKDNEDKYYINKIKNSGLIKEFIESQEQLIEHKRIIDELISRVEDLEKKEKHKNYNNDEIKRIEEENEKIDNDNKGIINTNNYINKNEEIMNDILNKNNNDDNKNIIEIQNTKITTIKTELANNYNKNEYLSKELNFIVPKNKEIKNIESKIEKEENDFKAQMIMFEENFKIISEQINKIKKEMEKNKKIIDFSQNEISHLKSSIQEKFENLKKTEENEMIKKEEKNKIGDNNLELMEKKMLKIIEFKFKELTNTKMENNILKEYMKGKIKEQTEQIILEIKNLQNKDVELENRINDLPDTLIVKRIEERIKLLAVEMEDYSTKKDLEYLKKEINKYENELSKLKAFNISQTEINGKYREEIIKIKNSFDNIKKTFSAISNLFENNSLSKIIEDLDDISGKMVEKEEYNEFVKEINKIISYLKIDINDHNRKFDQIMPYFKKILTVEDLNKLENSLTELIEKKNEDASGIFANKKEIVKSIKSIESKVKIFMKNLNKEREREKNEGAILASKPIGGYKCASCEAYLGELKDSYTYLPWNKYPVEERLYRKGNSLSRILQGLNIDNTVNPFIDNHEIKTLNEKKMSTDCLTVKNVKKVPPLLHVISEHNMMKNQIVEEVFNMGRTYENRKFPRRGNLRINNLREVNFLSKSKNSNENSFNKQNIKKKENEKITTKKIFKSKINSLKDNFDNQYYMPNP